MWRDLGTGKIARGLQNVENLGVVRSDGTPDATRTRDLLLRRQLLYPLSYGGDCTNSETIEWLRSQSLRPILAVGLVYAHEFKTA